MIRRTTSPHSNTPKTRGQHFQPGNPGRPRGSRGKATLAAQVLLDGEAQECDDGSNRSTDADSGKLAHYGDPDASLDRSSS